MKKTLIIFLLAVLTQIAAATSQFVTFSHNASDFPIVSQGKPLNILMDKNDYEGVTMAAQSLCGDIERVTGKKPQLLNEQQPECIIVGSMQSTYIKEMIKNGHIDGKELNGKNEKYLLQVVDHPLSGIDKALVIAGSDKRGAIYGIYELSRQIGVSPWYWWMDVPTVRHLDISIKNGVYTDGEPKVQYRGIFINDELPSFGNWAKEKFGGVNSKCYAHMFELLLRLKANFLWPAMWAYAFYDDDKESGPLADKMGIVMGTSHHEPMALAQQDWKRRGTGAWNYSTNAKELQRFWATGIERCKNWETLVTVGMRGDGDSEMEGGNNKKLLENIITDQRTIIADVTGKKAESTPQVWALYKEVQDYYDQGMKVPDDITLLLCDDNWGNIRRLPSLTEKLRKGGYGMYYHFDYVGIPRNAKWINTNSIPRVWEQMNLTYRYGVNKLWVVNVGDLKPMEYPITFFLNMAWNPENYSAESIIPHSVEFCKSVFGERYADEAARLLRTYSKFNHRVIPEQLDAKTFSMNYNEWARVTAEYDQLAIDAEALGKQLPAEYHDAWFQLLGYPIKAMANLYDMYYAQAMNIRTAKKKDAIANKWADRVVNCFKHDAELSKAYHEMNNGKWNNMMRQVHIGYTTWNDPKSDIMPEIKRIDGTSTEEIQLPTPAYESKTSAGKSPTFVEKDGCVSIEAEHFTRCTNGKNATWTVIPELGRTLSGITPQPITASVGDLWLEYDMEVTSSDFARIIVRFAPTLNFNKTGLSYAISLDGGKEKVVNINSTYAGELGPIQKDQIIDSQTIYKITKGKHTLRIRPLDNGLVLEKIMIDMGGMRKSFLGAPETLSQQ